MESDVENKTSVDGRVEDDSCPVTEGGVASPNSSGGSISSDTESWTLIDEDEVPVDDEVSLFASESVVKFAKGHNHSSAEGEAEGEKSAVDNGEPESRPQSDSDIEPASEDGEEGPPVTNLGSALLPTLEEQNQDSIVSDGIPVVESGDDEADGAGGDSPSQTWMWATEDDLTALSQQSKEEDLPRPDTADVLSTLYPMVNELPAEFPSIRKPVQPVYNHVPNKKLNVLLTTCVVMGCALGIGIGIGHFIGWSEKLELQELHAEERETKMDELTDSLVTCITGEEGNGGEDQDLEERVIRQLSEENNELKLALSQLKSCDGGNADESTTAPPIPVMLRQRINELMVANADLEKEVARLRQDYIQTLRHVAHRLQHIILHHRYAHSAMLEAEETKYDLHNSRSDLQRARETLNDVNTENQQLKIVIGKTRYGGGPATEAPETTSTSDEDEHVSNTSQEAPNCPRTVVDYVKTEWKRLKDSADKVWDKVVPDGQDQTSSWGQKFDAKIDSVLRSIPSKVAPAGKKLVKETSKIVNKLEDSLNKGLAKASHFLETQLGEDPLEWKDKQLNKLEKGLSLLLDEWSFDETFNRDEDVKEQKCKDKKDKNNNHECSAETECKASPKKEKYITKDKQKSDKKHKKHQKKGDESNKYEDKKSDKKRDKASGDWKKQKHQFKDGHNSTDVEKKWVFGRAKNREEFRNEDRKSDWVFDRASNRKKFHELTDAEWYEKKLKNKDCDGDNCDDLTEMNPGSQNHGKKSKHHKSDKARSHHKKQEGRDHQKKKPKDEAKISFRKHQETKEHRHHKSQRFSSDGDLHRHQFKEQSNKKRSTGDFHADLKFEAKRHKRDPRQQNPKKFGREQHNNDHDIRFN